MEQSALEKVKHDLGEIVKIIAEKFGEDYPKKNPDLVQHMMDKVQQEEDRKLTKRSLGIS